MSNPARARTSPIGTQGRHNAEEAADAALAAALEADADQPTGRRRALRARKEQQLHPYLYEKAQYTRQWRSRGLQPVHYRVVDDRAAETQDSFHNSNSQNEEQMRSFSSSPTQIDAASHSDVMSLHSPKRITRREISGIVDNGEDELPDIRSVLDAARQDGHTRRKRQKLAHPTRAAYHWNRRLLDTSVDEFAVPLSPPPTSSDSRAKAGIVPKFRLPYGMSPVAPQLPTPHVSSDVCPQPRDVLSELDLESPPRTRRRGLTTKPTTTSATVEISSDGESESGAEQIPASSQDSLRLNRVKKRIKGVLPASWLKIDLQAQKTRAPLSPSHRQPQSSPPSGSKQPAKGVAQRVTHRRPHSLPQTNPLIISDLEESDDSMPPTPLPAQKQTRLHQDEDQRRLVVLRDQTVDEDRMEADWIDPMYAGASRSHRKRVEPRKRQPRIDRVFAKSGPEQVRFPKDPVDFPMSKKASTSRRQKNQKASRGYHQKSFDRTLPLLSIEDASSSLSRPTGSTPQFVRVALRQARGQPNRGRHSPSAKAIRLTTKEDTDDAAAVLNAWRQGTFVGDLSVNGQRPFDSIPVSSGNAENEIGREERRSLQDITNQLHRPSMPHPGDDAGPKTGASLGRRGPHRRQSRLQQRPRASLAAAERPAQMLHEMQSVKRSLQRKPKAQMAQFRTAQLETIEREWDRDHRQAAFERRINCLTEAVHRAGGYVAREKDLPLQRFLQDEAAPSAPRPVHVLDSTTHDKPNSEPNTSDHRSTLPRRRRKRQAKQIDADARQYRQPSEPLPEVSVDYSESWRTDLVEARSLLEGLGPSGTRYATDFDIQPLGFGTYFRQSTFVGSGEFIAALNLDERDLNIASGQNLRIQLGKDMSDWSAWTEDVANDIARIPGILSEHLTLRSEVEHNDQAEHSNADHILRSLVRYYVQFMHFLDHVDRRACLQHTMRFAQNMVDLLEVTILNEPLLHDTKSRIWQYVLVVTKIAVLMTNDAIIDRDLRQNSRNLMAKVARGLVRQTFPSGFEKLRISYEENRFRSKRESGFADKDVTISTVVILHHTLANEDSQESLFWDVLENAHGDLGTLKSVRAMDNVWQNVFSVLPVLEIDAYGVLHVGSRFNSSTAGWTLVKRLLDRTLRSLPSTDVVGSPGASSYIRAVLTRCHHLLATWGWWSCEPMLITIFDFFARRKFAQLYDEGSQGSPAFLREHTSPAVRGVRADEPAFHIFLKMMAMGLEGMRQHYTDKKIGGIAFRFIPAHGREYRKEAEVRQRDLDALCNHMDLLCTLYCSLPESKRPSISHLQGLVDHSTSHREACRLSVRLWSNITAFQISTDESVERLRPLASWFQEMLHITFVQFRLARSEAEHDFELAKSAGASGVTQDMMDATISCNQRQIALTLVDALVGLKHAFQCSKTKDAAAFMAQESGYLRIFETVDLSERRLLPVFDEALRLTRTCLDVHGQAFPITQDQAAGEDSQEYGDLGALHELVADEQMHSEVTAGVSSLVYGPVARLVSNIFGADTSLDDTALVSLIDVWIRVAEASVRSSTSGWASYLDDYSPHSWSQLRNTEQKRKFTPYALACMVDKIGDDFFELREKIMGAWLSSLLEREAVLKYQHLLTTALLNNYSEDGLLYNLPFVRTSVSGKFNVTLDELRQRRVALISCILSNMREDLDLTSRERPLAVPDLRHTYADMLHQAMRVMKDCYLELQTGQQSAIADSTVQGAYVLFVQHVISMLQQYATDICKIDTFFTDSSAFPLPVGDRTYVVGRLRSYTPKLSESGTRKLLAVFVHTVGERAAADNEQQYLVNQLCTAVDGVFECSNTNVPSLRQVLLTAVFPVYIANALSGECTWLLAAPILQASSKIMRSLVYTANLRDRDSMNMSLAAAEAIIHAVHQPLEHAILNPNLFDKAHIQKIVALAFETGLSALTLCNHCERLLLAKPTLTHHLNKMRRYAMEVSTSITGGGGHELSQLPVPPLTEHLERWPDTRKFVEDQLHATFRPLKEGGHWSSENGRYMLQKDRQPVRDIVVDLGDGHEQRANLLRSIKAFLASHKIIFAQSGDRRIELPGSMAMGDLTV
nr:protein mms22 [Quercus suber]